MLPMARMKVVLHHSCGSVCVACSSIEKQSNHTKRPDCAAKSYS